MCACLALHNYLCQTSNASYTPAGFVDSECSDGSIKPGEWRAMIPNNGGLQPVKPVRGSRPREECVRMRNDIKDYFLTESGKIPWQETYVNRTYGL